MTRAWPTADTYVRHPTGEVLTIRELLTSGRAILHHTNAWAGDGPSPHAYFVNVTDVDLSAGESTGWRIRRDTFRHLVRRGFRVEEHDGWAGTTSEVTQ